MGVTVVGFRMALLSVGLLASTLVTSNAWAERTRNTPPQVIRPAVLNNSGAHHTTVNKVVLHTAPTTKSKQTLLKGGKAQYGYRGGMQCVTFARANTGVQLSGNAANWWDAASGVYARGQAPERGSVLNFRANGHMRLGHVAVVSQVVSDREITIDHANWAGPGVGRGGITRGMSVIDVSANNDWSAVRVGLGQSGSYGSVYPTYGFIYDRRDNGRLFPAYQHLDEIAEAPMRTLR